MMMMGMKVMILYYQIKSETFLASQQLVEFGMEGAAELHVLNQVGPLTLVGRNDADLIGFGSSLQQPGGYFLHIRCLSPA